MGPVTQAHDVSDFGSIQYLNGRQAGAFLLFGSEQLERSNQVVAKIGFPFNVSSLSICDKCCSRV